MNEENLVIYYNKFNEDKRLNTKHGNIEFITALNYIDMYIKPSSFQPVLYSAGMKVGVWGREQKLLKNHFGRTSILGFKSIFLKSDPKSF